MGALDQLEQMVAAAKAQADQLEQLKAAVEAMQQTTSPDLQPQIDALVKERDQLREVIQAEIDDAKTDTTRLEKALAPVEQAPTPVVDQPTDTGSADAKPRDQATPQSSGTQLPPVQ